MKNRKNLYIIFPDKKTFQEATNLLQEKEIRFFPLGLGVIKLASNDANIKKDIKRLLSEYVYKFEKKSLKEIYKQQKIKNYQ